MNVGSHGRLSLLGLSVFCGCGFVSTVKAAEMRKVEANRMAEWTLTSDTAYADPFNELQVDVVFTEPSGGEVRVPAFWAGGQQWRFRYASGKTGRHTWRSTCSDATNDKLHGIGGQIEVVSYAGDNPLYRHGPLGVAKDRRHLEHADGTPFLWLGDTWWMGLCRRLEWPDEFKRLTADRREKGFNVIQIVAGLYPDMPAFDERGANEASFPWEKGYTRIRPEYFDAADRRIEYLADLGLMPCIVGAWGYHLPWLGVDKMKQHWRYLIARYGALPVVWCVAGEGTMPYYLSKKKTEEAAFQKRGWTQIAAYMRAIDPFHRLVTIHPGDTSRNVVDDISVLDFDMLQTGHSDRSSIPNTIRLVRSSRAAAPTLPVVNGEVCYEGILDSCYEEVQRFMVWSCLLSGTAGHTYGANGIWQVNREGKPYGASPHGGNWGNRPWNEAMTLPGSRQVGLAKRLLEKYPWYRFEPRPEWAALQGDSQLSLAGANWIWFPEGNPAEDAPVGKRFFRKTFDLPDGKAVGRATLLLSADDRFTAWLNGRKLGSHADWRTARQFPDVEKSLKSGKNVLAVMGENGKAAVAKNPAGLICRMEVRFADGQVMTFGSDETWRCAKEESPSWRTEGFDDTGWALCRVAAPFGQGPWGSIGGREEFLVSYAAGIPGTVRVIYVPTGDPVLVQKIEANVSYNAACFDPVTGRRTDLGAAHAKADGEWTSPVPPTSGHDWVLILEAASVGERR